MIVPVSGCMTGVGVPASAWPASRTSIPSNGARERDVGVDIPLQPGVALRVGLHWRRLPLMREEHDEIDIVAKLGHRKPHRLRRIGDVERRDERGDDSAYGVLPHDADDADANTASFDDGVRLGEGVVRVLIEEVRAEHGKRGAVFLPRQNFRAVFELVIADRHRVVAHRDHQLESERAFGQLGERAGEDITGVEQESIGLALPQLAYERRHLGDAADHRQVVEPKGWGRIVSAFDVVGE